MPPTMKLVKKYHIPYYDTYEERQATFEKIIKDLKEKGS